MEVEDDDGSSHTGAIIMSSEEEEENEAKRVTMRDTPAPAGYRRVKVPPPSRNRPMVYEHGVRFEQDCDKPDPKKQKWMCACSGRCRASSMKCAGAIHINATYTGNATRHLRDAHNITSNKSATTQATKATRNAKVSKAKQAVEDSPDPGRLMLLMYVKVFIISHLLAFSLSDSADMRLFFEVCGDVDFPRTTLHPKMIKHVVVELYNATISKFSNSIRQAIAGAGGAALHANFDLWTSNMSNEKYIGLRLFWCTSKFVLDSALVAVKLFQPSAELSGGGQLSDTLLSWVEEVLKEFGLNTSDLLCTVTDAGSDVKRLCLKVMTSAWEWCFPHMLNCVLVEAFGTNASRAACKNPAVRKVIDEVKKVVEHMNKSSLMKVKFDDIQYLMYGNTTKLVNAVPHRWISTCNVLEQVLCNWAALEEHYQKNEQGQGIFPLAAHKTEIEELFSLMKPIAVVIKESQEKGVPTGLATFTSIVMLRRTTLDASKPLSITVPRKAVAAETGTTHTTSIERPAESLKAVSTTTREMLAAALDKRFFNKRYDEYTVSSPEPDYVFEMAACMSPSLQQMRWLPAMCSSETEAARVHKVIKGKVVDLMIALAEGQDAQPVEEAPEGGGGGAGGSGFYAVPPQKRKHGLFSGGSSSTGKRQSDKTKLMLASGVFGESSINRKGNNNDDPTNLTIRAICQQEFDRYLARFADAYVDDYPTEDLLAFWANEGRALYSNMARAARVLLALPASSAVLERDFSTAGRLITETRSRLDAAFVEMVLFLNGNQEYIPMEVPVLSKDQASKAVPERLSNPTDKTGQLSAGEVAADSSVDEFEAESKEFSV